MHYNKAVNKREAYKAMIGRLSRTTRKEIDKFYYAVTGHKCYGKIYYEGFYINTSSDSICVYKVKKKFRKEYINGCVDCLYSKSKWVGCLTDRGHEEDDIGTVIIVLKTLIKWINNIPVDINDLLQKKEYIQACMEIS
jgi:hypothetical protein